MTLPTLRTPRLVLRPFSLADAPRVQELAGSREVASTTLNIPHPYEDGMAEAWIEGHADAWEAGKRLPLAVITPSAGLVGAVALHLALAHRRAELGYWIGVPYWNRGYATEAAGAVLDYAFTELGLHRILARYMTRNPASGRVMQKLGMIREGVLREHFLKWGHLEDVAVHAVLAAEWRDRLSAGGEASAGPEDP